MKLFFEVVSSHKAKLSIDVKGEERVDVRALVRLDRETNFFPPVVTAMRSPMIKTTNDKANLQMIFIILSRKLNREHYKLRYFFFAGFAYFAV